MSELNKLGRIGLGTFSFSGVFSPVKLDTAIEIVRCFLENGGRYIETAPVYPRPYPLRKVLGVFPRESYVIASKCVTHVGPDGNKIRTGAYDAIVAQAESEIERLGVEYLDVLQAHITPEDVEPSETIRALEFLRETGRVRWIGVSNVTLDQLKRFSEGGHVDLVQNRLSLVHRASYASLVEYCSSHDIRCNPYQVIERGQLAEGTSLETGLDEADIRRKKVEYTGDTYRTVRDWVMSSIAPIAHDLGVSLEALAISWVLQRPQVQLGVVGATSVSQVQRNLAAQQVSLPASAVDAIEARFSTFSEGIRERYGLTVEEYRGLGA